MAAFRIKKFSVKRAFAAVQSVASYLWGGVGVARETFAGAWQAESRGVGQAKRSPLSHSAVFTCIGIISSDIAKLPLRVMRPRMNANGAMDPTLGYEVHYRHPLTALFREPNHYQTMLQFLQAYLASKLWTGNTYVLIFRDARGVPESMHVLDPTSVTPTLTEDGSVFYLVKATKLNGLTEDVYIPARDILHDRAVCLFHPLVGVTPLYAAATSAMTGNNIADNSQQFFSNMSRASGTLTAPGPIPADVAARLKVEWDNNYAGLGFGKVAVLGSGLEWKPLTINAVDSQLIDQLRYSVEDIGRIYRVPSFMLGDNTKQTYRNSEQGARFYFQGCLSYHIESMEQCFNLKFELSGGSMVQFDLSPLFRMETDLRYATHGTALKNGIKSINEIRAEENLPPVKGGEEPRLQVQYVPLSMSAQMAAAGGAPGAAPKPVPAAEDPEDAADEADPAEEDDPAAETDAAKSSTQATPGSGSEDDTASDDDIFAFQRRLIEEFA